MTCASHLPLCSLSQPDVISPIRNMTGEKRPELIAISGDMNDNDADVRPDAEGKWIPSDEENPADASADAVSVDVPVSATEEVVVEYGIPGMNIAEVPEDGDIYTVTNISDCGHTSEIGKPQLPAVRRYVAVPEGSVIRIMGLPEEELGRTGRMERKAFAT